MVAVESRRNAERGESLIEFALIVPILLILLVGLFEAGRAWNAYQVLTDAAREGARVAVVAGMEAGEDSVRAIARNALHRASLDPELATIELDGIGGETGTPARVSIEYPYRFAFLQPLLGWLDERARVTLGTATVMRNE